ncbi:cellulase family glycosylhydrolase [Streptomyces clavuligerus]|uniref:cellulase family glycosylhydrolase n=1 Tax=Streptomyces clavuligerus TaxID=1901 RepID=UPI0039C6194A
MKPPRTVLRPLGGAGTTLAVALLVGLLTAPAAPAAPADALPADRAPRAAVLEAEDATISQGAVESNHRGYTGRGFVNYDNLTGSSVEWTVRADKAGTTPLTLRFANGTTVNRPMTISVNGTPALTGRSFPGNGSWTSWQTANLDVPLREGDNTIRATATTANGGPNVDSLTVPDSGGPGPGPGPGPGGTPVGINGQLTVCGTKLCNQYGKPIQLRGMSTHGLQWYSQCATGASLDALAKDWNADVLRISMYIQEGGYDSDPRGFTDRVHNLIEQATARGMYALVDWHMLDPGDPHANLSKAKTFFTEIARRHNNKKNLIYEIANEPSGVSWSRIKSYAEELIPVIRQSDPETTVLVGTRAWSSLGVSDGATEAETVSNPVNASNIMYTFHFYAASHKDEYFNAFSRAADRIPGDGGNDFAASQRYMDLMASKKISWTNWNYSDDFRSGAVFKTGVCNAGAPTPDLPAEARRCLDP